MSDATAKARIGEAMILALRSRRGAEGLTSGVKRLMSEEGKFVVPDALRSVDRRTIVTANLHVDLTARCRRCSAPVPPRATAAR
jgi:hypothetical protein